MISDTLTMKIVKTINTNATSLNTNSRRTKQFVRKNLLKSSNLIHLFIASFVVLISFIDIFTNAQVCR